MKRLRIVFSSLPFLLALRFAIVYTLKKLLNDQSSINYSQTGEDAMIRSLLDETRTGIYVDVGCHDPIYRSNTLSLYLHGWRGVNIDANPRLVKRFAAVRLRDIAVCATVSDETRELVFHEFDDELVSTVSESVLLEWEQKWTKRGERRVTPRSLDSILNDCLEPGADIDLLSIDVEDHELNVLRSVNLDVHRPKLIVVEMHHLDLAHSGDHAITQYLRDRDFRQIGYDTLNGYFVDTRSQRPGLRLP